MTDTREKDIETVAQSLKENRFDPVQIAENADEAIKMVLDMIPVEARLGIAGSTSVTQLGLFEKLIQRGVKGFDFTDSKEVPLEELMKRPYDTMLTSSNAVTLDGKLVNIDGTGNRVAGMIFGPSKVVLIIGWNKIVRDVDEAVDRIKNVIAPYHAKYIDRKTPCAKTGQCTDCNAPERICNVTTIIEKRPTHSDVSIVLVREDLGLGWNPDWPEAHREKIASVYREEIERLKAAFQAYDS